jgi:hypothetical protein
MASIKTPGVGKRYAAGLKEVCGVNPTQLGLTFGTYTAPIFGAIFGPLFLKNPFAYAGAGSYETLCGALAVYGYNGTAKLRWRRHVNKKIRAHRKANKSADIGLS